MQEEPLVRVVRGTPSVDELAAIITVLTSKSVQHRRTPAGNVTEPLGALSHVGPSQWVLSGRPTRSGRAWRQFPPPPAPCGDHSQPKETHLAKKFKKDQ